MKQAWIGTLLLLFASEAGCAGLALEAEVLEASQVALPGSASDQIGYVLLHHKHQKDQAQLSAWLHQHSGARVEFEMADGTVHPGALQRLKHCFGRGLLLYANPVPLKEKMVIRLRLEEAG